MTSTSTIGVAFLGVGRLGDTHPRNLTGSSGVQVLAVANPNGEAAERGKVVANPEVALTDNEKAITHPGVDAVIIVTPTETHAQLIEIAVQAGKAAFSEKPITLDVAETSRVVGLVQEKGFMRRFDPGYSRANAKNAPGNSASSRPFGR
jgi:predicted dehydrogenase